MNGRKFCLALLFLFEGVLFAQGTPEFLGDINLTGSSQPTQLQRIGTKIIFSADDGIQGLEPFIFEESTGGITILKDIEQSPGTSSVPQEFAAFDSVVFFSATDSLFSNIEPWISNGTTAGTMMLADISPGGSSAPRGFFNYNGSVYFSATDDSGKTSFFKSDGTSSGTLPIPDSLEFSSISWLVPLGGKFIFEAYSSSSGYEIYSTELTPHSTQLLSDLASGPTGSSPQYLTALDSVVLFSANDGLNSKELYVTDGTPSGTQLLKDLLPGSPCGCPTALTRLGQKIFFQGPGGLWESDGTTIGTQLLYPNLRFAYPQKVGTQIFFSGITDPNNPDWEIWKTDGTFAGTKLVKNVNTMGSSNARGFVEFAGSTYFIADDGVHGFELWRTDGTESGTELVYDINSGAGSSNPSEFLATENHLYFSADDGQYGMELWRVDTTVVTSMVPGLEKGLFQIGQEGNSIWVKYPLGFEFGSVEVLELSGRKIGYSILDNSGSWEFTLPDNHYGILLFVFIGKDDAFEAFKVHVH